MLKPLRIIKKISFLYLLFCLMFFVIKNDDFPAWYDTLLQLVYLFLNYLLAKIIFTNKKGLYLYIGIFTFHIACAFLSQYVNYSIYGDAYGYNPIDAQLYRSIAFKYNTQSVYEMLKGLAWQGYLFDDYGYPIVTWFVGSISKEYFMYLLVIVNGFAITISSYYLYKLSSLFTSVDNSKLIVFLWGTMPFAIYVTANGLKENVFAMVLIVSLWQLYKCAMKFSIINLLLFLLFCIIIFMFRLVLGYAMIVAYLAYLVFNNKYVIKHYRTTMTVVIIILLLVSKSVSSSIIEQRGHDIDSMSESASNKISEAGGTIALLTNYLSAFVGPFPNFVSESFEKRTYITRYSFTALTKSLISFFLLFSIWHIVKRKITILFPMLAFWGINVIMLIFTFRTLDVRFQWPHFPIVLILSFYMYENLRYIPKKNLLINSYILFICLLIFVYNMR